MAKQDPNSSTSPSKPREQLAQYTGPAGSRSLAADRVGHQAAIRVPYHAGPPWVATLVFAFHESEEVGPRMLARVAKRTGLTPEDL
jgi:hypothetical protein